VSGACTGGGECVAGTAQQTTFSCGECPTGERTATRSCDQSCNWSDWGDFGVCNGGLGCGAREYCCGETRCLDISRVCDI
jgi:hypothetical protein